MAWHSSLSTAARDGTSKNDDKRLYGELKVLGSDHMAQAREGGGRQPHTPIWDGRDLTCTGCSVCGGAPSSETDLAWHEWHPEHCPNP